MAQTQLPAGHPMAVKVYSASGAIEPTRRSAMAFVEPKRRRRRRKVTTQGLYRRPRRMGQY